MEASHVLLGRPWQYDRKVIHDGVSNKFSSVYISNKVTLKPLTLEEVLEDQIKMNKKENKKRKRNKKQANQEIKKRILRSYHYLYSSKFEVFSNHKSLEYLFDQKELNMRQRWWLEYLKDFEFDLSYDPGKANVVVDALNRKTLHVSALMVREIEFIEQFRDFSLEAIAQGRASSFTIGANGIVRLQDRVCVLSVPELRKLILESEHAPWCHEDVLGSQKDVLVAWYEDSCHQVCVCLSNLSESEDRALETIKPLHILEWNWDSILMDFVSSLPRT
ncbi:Retrovirus-related Pol polyprotein from transposon 17.6, partial [Mucuna pruriens]